MIINICNFKINLLVDYCQNPEPCFNGGTCTNTTTGYQCTCKTNYVENQCEICKYFMYPCNFLYGRFNTFLILNTYENWFSIIVDYCQNPEPCFNGGICTNTTTGYQCTCATNYVENQCKGCK